MAAALPFMKFYPRDWVSDPGVRSLTLPARGLWIEMLVLMHHSPDRGYLLTPLGAPMTPATLARTVGAGIEECAALLAELEASGVFSRDERGVIYSRRMLREVEFRRACSEAGRKGGGNPTFGTSENPSRQRAAKVGTKVSTKVGTKAAQSLRSQKTELIPSADKPPEVPQTTEPRPARQRNPLFDAVAEVTRTDPATAGGLIGKVAAALAKADPPYTPDEVREFGRRFWALCPWGQRDNRPPTPNELQTHIGKVRATPPPTPDLPRVNFGVPIIDKPNDPEETD